jgi:hypothetical protein
MKRLKQKSRGRQQRNAAVSAAARRQASQHQNHSDRLISIHLLRVRHPRSVRDTELGWRGNTNLPLIGMAKLPCNRQFCKISVKMGEK